MLKALPVLLLLGIPALGGLNYARNAPLDEELRERPYAGLSDADLAALVAAYRSEVQQVGAEIESEPGLHAFNDPARFGQYGEKVEAFEKFQESNEQWKRARGRLAGQKGTLETLVHEESVRARGLHRPLGRIWRRVSTF